MVSRAQTVALFSVFGGIVAALGVTLALTIPSAQFGIGDDFEAPVETASIDRPKSEPGPTLTSTPIPPRSPMPTVIVEDQPIDGTGTDDSAGFAEFSSATIAEMKSEAERAALAWVTFRTGEPTEARSERLSEWFAGHDLTRSPLLSRAEFNQAYNPKSLTVVEDAEVLRSYMTSPSASQAEDRYIPYRVTVQFDATFGAGTKEVTRCAPHDAVWEIAVPWALNDDQTELVIDDSRPFVMNEPATHECVPSV